MLARQKVFLEFLMHMFLQIVDRNKIFTRYYIKMQLAHEPRENREKISLANAS